MTCGVLLLFLLLLYCMYLWCGDSKRWFHNLLDFYRDLNSIYRCCTLHEKWLLPVTAFLLLHVLVHVTKHWIDAFLTLPMQKHGQKSPHNHSTYENAQYLYRPALSDRRLQSLTKIFAICDDCTLEDWQDRQNVVYAIYFKNNLLDICFNWFVWIVFVDWNLIDLRHL